MAQQSGWNRPINLCRRRPLSSSASPTSKCWQTPNLTPLVKVHYTRLRYCRKEQRPGK
ncbi:hypothetical protein LZ32DRAFT_598905 [Colletotrichum eremochloae]|nr:hypothetical protein LZ32DRAFT_598905 [Colletotrichum eremochloae]